MTTPQGAPTLTTDEQESLAAALRAEHAAVFAYGLVAAFALAQRRAAVAAATAAHEARRDTLTDALTAAGAPAPVAEAGYSVPLAVTDGTTAVRLAERVETDTAVAWRAVLERSGPTPAGTAAGTFDARTTALAGLTDCAVRATAWRTALGTAPATTAFPGAPTTTGS